MFELRKSFNFEASHVLERHDGKCSRFHGHSYVLTVVMQHGRLKRFGPKKHMVTDFSDISAAVKPLIASHLDHHHLNDTLKTDSPTAEYIAMWVYRALAPKLAWLIAIELRETASSVVTYRPSAKTRERYKRRYHGAAVAAESDEEFGSSDEEWDTEIPESPSRVIGTTNGVGTTRAYPLGRPYANGNGFSNGNGHSCADGCSNGSLTENGHGSAPHVRISEAAKAPG